MFSSGQNLWQEGTAAIGSGGKAKTRKRKAKETPPPKYKSAWKHENKPGFTALFFS
jgi:hypothetical protein